MCVYNCVRGMYYVMFQHVQPCAGQHRVLMCIYVWRCVRV